MTNNDHNTRMFLHGVEYSRDDLVDFKVIALLLGLSPRTIQDMTSRRELPVYLFGLRKNRYRIGDIVEWREQRKYRVC